MATDDTAARKRRVNLTLNEGLVAEARELTENLSAVVESLLGEYVAQEKQRRATQADNVRETVAIWNRFAKERGSFSDEHFTL